MMHPLTGLDDIVHQRTRLGILVLLSQGGDFDFGSLRDQLGVTDGNLSQHLRVLEEASYVLAKKGYEGRRPRTWLSITRQGRKALDRELALLRQVVGTEGATAPTRRAPRATAKGTSARSALAPEA